jgi:hypothetical protein
MQTPALPECVHALVECSTQGCVARRELPSEWQDGRSPTFDHGLVRRKSEGSAAIAALETARYVFMTVSGNEYPSARPHREQALITDGRGILLGQQF